VRPTLVRVRVRVRVRGCTVPEKERRALRGRRRGEHICARAVSARACDSSSCGRDRARKGTLSCRQSSESGTRSISGTYGMGVTREYSQYAA
jgi:hypothetical protein